MTNAQLNQWINTFYRYGAIDVDERNEFKNRLNVLLEDFATITADLSRYAQWLPERNQARWTRQTESQRNNG